MVLKNSCSGYNAPSGWKFQDCHNDFITLLRQKNVAWEVKDWKDLGEDLRDAYVSAEEYEKGKWEIIAFSPDEGHGGGINRRSRIDAIKELTCLARAEEVMITGTGTDYGDLREKYVKKLDKCRDSFGI